MFSSMKFQKDLRNIAENANTMMHCSENCTCPMTIHYSEDCVGIHSDIVSTFQFRISGVTYLFVEARFCADKMQLSIMTNGENMKRYIIDNDNDAQNMLDVITEYVNNYMNSIIAQYQAA